MPNDIDSLSLTITSTARPAASAVYQLAKRLTELSVVLNAIDTTKLKGAFSQLATTFKENGITVNYVVKQTAQAAQTASTAADTMSKSLHSATGSATNASNATSSLNDTLREQITVGKGVREMCDQLVQAYGRSVKAQQAAQTAQRVLEQQRFEKGISRRAREAEGTQAMADYVRAANAAQNANEQFAGVLQQVEALFRYLPDIIANVNRQLGTFRQEMQSVDTGKGVGVGLLSFVQGSKTFGQIQQAIGPVVAAVTKGMEAAGIATEGFSNALSTATTVAAGVGIAIKAVAEAVKMFVKLVKTGYQLVRKFVQVAQSVKKFLEDKLGITELKSLINSIVSMLKRQIIRRAINNALSAIEDGFTTGIENLEKYDARFGQVMSNYRNAMGLFKNSVAVAFAPIIAYAIPYLVNFLNTLTWVCNQIARLTALLTGQHTYTIAKSYEEIKDAANAAGSAAKEAAKTILGFDEINQLNGNKGSGGGTGAGSGDALSAYETLPVGDWPYNSWGEAFSAFLDWLNGKIPSLEDTLTKAADWFNDFNLKLYEMFTFDGVQDKISELGTNIGVAINTFLNEKLDWEQWGKTIGIALQSALNFAGSFLAQLDFVELGSHFVDFISGALSQIKPRDLADILATPITAGIKMVGGFLSNPKIGEIALFGSQVANGMVNAIRDAFDQVNWDEVKKNVINALNTFFDNLNVDGFLDTMDDVTNTIYDIVMSALKELVNNPKFTRLIGGIFVRLAALAARFFWDTFVYLIPDGLMMLFRGMGLDFGTVDLGEHEADMYGLYDPMLAGMEDTKQSVAEFERQLNGITDDMLADTSKDFAAIAQTTNKSFGEARTAVETQTARMRTTYSGDLSRMSSDTTLRMREMSEQCGKYASDASRAITNNLNTAKTNATKAASDLQVGVSNNLKGLSGAATSGVNSLNKSVTDGLTSAKNNAVKAATDAQKGVTNAFNSMYGGAKGGMNNLIYGAEKMANGIIDANNTIIKSFDSMHIGGKKVASSSGYVNKVSIPRLATGGIISSPTQAILGERGAEAVMPLERNTGWIDRLANTIAESVTQTAPVSQGGDTYVMLDGKVIAKAVNRINQRDNRRYSPVG